MARIERLADIQSVGADWWVVDGIFSGLSLLWGSPGTGKSFVAISIAASVASGRPWLGRHTRQGRVVYIAGEGGAEAVARRMRAALAEWTVEPDEEPVPIDVVTPGVDLTSGPAEIMGLIAEREPPILIVVDTLSRCFTGDENKQEFMAGFVRSLDLMRDAYPRSCILVIHHSNKEDEVRGSTVLSGAVDTSWKLVRIPIHNGMQAREIIPQKLRERDVDGAINRLVMAQVGCRDANGNLEVDSFGDFQTSLVVKPHPDDIARTRVVETTAMGLFAHNSAVSYQEWRVACGGMSKADFDSSLSYILSYPGAWSGIVQTDQPGVFVLDKHGATV